MVRMDDLQTNGRAVRGALRSGRTTTLIIMAVMLLAVVVVLFWAWMPRPEAAPEAAEHQSPSEPVALKHARGELAETFAKDHEDAAFLIEQGHMDRATAILTQLIDKHPGYVEHAKTHALLARAGWASKDWSQTYEAARASLKIDTQQPEMHFTAAMAGQELERWDEARQHLEKAIDLRDDPRDHMFYANLLIQREQWDDAARHARRTIALSPGAEMAHAMLAKIAANHGDHGEALQHINRAIGSLDEQTLNRAVKLRRLHIQKGRYLHEVGRTGDAINILTALPSEARWHIETLRALEPLLMAQQRYEELAQAWADYMVLGPEHQGEAAARAAIAFHHAGDPNNAQLYLRMAQRYGYEDPIVIKAQQMIDANAEQP